MKRLPIGIENFKEFLYLILDYSHNHYTFKHFGV